LPETSVSLVTLSAWLSVCLHEKKRLPSISREDLCTFIDLISDPDLSS
jgi:hypothetical protein